MDLYMNKKLRDFTDGI